MKAALTVAFAMSVAGCAGPSGTGALEQAPIDRTQLQGDYQQIAGCAYAKFVYGTSNVMQRNEFPERKQTRLTMMGGTLKAWELVLTQSTSEITEVELTSIQTMFGPDKLSTKNVMSDLKSCEQPIKRPPQKRR